jgi:hypothetical protein
MVKEREGIPVSRVPNPYFFDGFWQAVTKANRARSILRKIYWQQHNDNGQKPVGPAGLEESTDLSPNNLNPTKVNNTGDGYIFARLHVKIIGQTNDLESDPRSSDSTDLQ